MRFSISAVLLCLAVVTFPVASHAADNVFISEFQAVNEGPLEDEDGEKSDWIEIHNAGTNTVDLNNWYLTDRADQLTQWRFPATNLPPNAYMIVFASAKNRRTPGAPLHTNFKLNDGGEYLALVRPGGTNVASAFSPAYPVQVGFVAYGIPTVQTNVTLITTGTTARVHVPPDAALEPFWTGSAFNDSSWTALPLGVGFETDGLLPFVPVTNANSVAEFSGVQGQNNWHYGYWNRNTDLDGNYSAEDFIPFPNGGGGWSASEFWTGSAWDWFAGDPPFTQLTATGGRPSGDNGGFTQTNHWAVRRHISEIDGLITISGSLTHTSDWVYVTVTGTAGVGALYMYLTGAGDGYIDDIKVVAGTVPEVGVNLITNGDFETGASAPWNVTANMVNSAVTSAVKHSGTYSLRLSALAAGTTQGDSVWQPFTVTASTSYTLSYWFLPVPNNPSGRIRSSGSWLNTTAGPPGDGAIARVFVDGTQVFQQLAYNINTNYAVNVSAHLGSKIDFALDAGVLDNDTNDSVIFTGVVATADPSTQTVADTADDWSWNGVQGEKNWFQGYWNKNADADLTYQATNFTAFPRNSGPHGSNNFWDGMEWDWPSGNPPFDKIGQYWMIPNGTNSGAHHWVIRRWVSEVSGNVTVNWSALKEYPDQNNSGGTGVVVRVLHKGVQRDSAIIFGGDTVGVQRTVVIPNVAVGDPIDIALDPTDVTGFSHDDTDKTLVRATILGKPSLSNHVASGISGTMQGVNPSAYVRVPFVVANPAAFNVLTLRMKFDDGFVAHLNGVEVARGNAPPTAGWNSAAPATRPDTDNNEWMEFNLSSSLGLLFAGTNVLAIQGLNASASDGDFLVLPELIASTATYDLGSPRYFTLPTPGTLNGSGNTNLGPLIADVGHSPAIPLDTENINVTARVTPTFYPVGAVSVIYRVNFSNEVTLAMFDDGAHGDGAAGDSVFGAAIPASASSPGQLVRYYVHATDNQANPSRHPAFLEPRNSPQYEGTVVFNPTLTNPLPVMHLFVQNTVAATNAAGTRATLFWDGELFDNIEVSAHGQTTWYVFPKRSMNVNLNTGYKLRPHPGSARVKAFDLLTTSADKAYLRMPLAFEAFRDAGVPTHDAFPVRIQQNNAFHSVMHFVEQADDDFLDRNGLSPTGALYKVYLPLDDAYTGAKKLTRKQEPNDDLQALIDGLAATAPANDVRNFMFDNVDIPEVVNFLATLQHVQNEDCCYKNYFLYRDTGGNREWQVFPWDMDLTFGRVFTAWQQVGTNIYGGYYNTNLYATNLYYSQARSLTDYIGVSSLVPDAIFRFPETLAMFYRRWTTIQEEMLQKTNVHPLLANKIEKRVDQYAAQIAPDAALDFNKWVTMNPPSFLVSQTLAQAVSLMKTNYFAPRRTWIFNQLNFAANGPYLGTQPTNASLRIGAIEYNPSSGNQAQEYLELINTNNYSVDISGWKLSGAIEHTFKGGVVVPSNGVLYVSPDVNAFRARTSGPRGGQGLFVQGNYKGGLSARGESVVLNDNTGRLIASTNYPGTPSLAQQHLRVTEIMFHPAAPPPGISTNADEFEFIELKNTGPVNLNLVGVRLTSGVTFTFTSASFVTNLAPGESVAVVRNLNAFISRYGGGLRVAGTFTGQLDNAGENIRLEDAGGERILDFDYNGSWYPITDGFGFSLAIVNELAAWDVWGLKSSWRPSGEFQGSPARTNGPPVAVPLIKINEALTHTDLPSVDSIELFNAGGASAGIGGWFLTDDFRTPKKYRLPNGTTIAGLGYLAFTEAQFNSTNALVPFSLSSTGDELYLFSAETNGNLTGWYHGFDFGAAANGVAFGRHTISTGDEHFVAQAANSPTVTNAAPLVGPVVVSEIMYHPPEFADGSDNNDDEFVELRNITGAAVTLYDPAFPTNSWRVGGGIEFTWPASTTLNANEAVLLVNFNPTNSVRSNAFRVRYSVPATVRYFGPYGGKLDNSADTVRVERPDAPDTNGVPFILVDRVRYSDSAPWPGGADGGNTSLQRLSLTAYGDDPANWSAARPVPGGNFIGGTPPVITVHPVNVLTGATMIAAFHVGATGTAPLSHQWRFNGAAIAGATSPSLYLTNVQFSQTGVYSVVVFNSAGSVVSSNAALSLALPGYITFQPTNLNIRIRPDPTAALTTNATFAVAAYTTTAPRYQWRKDGVDIPGATNATYVLSNVTIASRGSFEATVSDAIGTLISQPAVLTPWITPQIVYPMAGQSVPINTPVTLSITITGYPPPFGYEWKRGASTTLASNTSMSAVDFLTFNATSIPGTNAYRVLFRNVAGGGSFPTNIITLADTDGDGMNDAWESANGLNPNSNADRNIDSDGDRMSNWQEFVAGTNPQDSSSYLRLDPEASGGANLTFRAVSNRTYTVQYSMGLETGAWFTLSDVTARTNNVTHTIADPNWTTNRFYRLVTPRQP